MSCYVAHLSSAHTRHCGIEVNIRLAENKLHLKLIKALVNYTDKIPNSEDLRFDSIEVIWIRWGTDTGHQEGESKV